MSSSATLIALTAIIAWAVLRLAKIRAGDTGRHGGPHGNQASSAYPSPRELELQREVEELRERIQVLERIAIDGRQARDIAAEIENLRDT